MKSQSLTGIIEPKSFEIIGYEIEKAIIFNIYTKNNNMINRIRDEVGNTPILDEVEDELLKNIENSYKNLKKIYFPKDLVF